MFKKIVLIFFLIISLFIIFDVNGNNEACKKENIGNLSTDLQSCINGSSVIQSGELKVESGFKTIIIKFIKNVSTVLALAAIGFIAYGSMVLVASGGEDEKIKKGKNIIKWSLIGFAGLVSASGIIAIIVNLIYGI